MATEEEIAKVILKVEGEDKVRKLSEAVAQEERQLAALIATLGRHDAATRASAGALADFQAQLKAAEKAAGAAGGMFGVSAHKVQVLGQGLDDLQYVGEQGLRPIINNVMQLDARLGILMIAGQLLYSQWDNLSKLFSQGHVKTQAEEMEELRKKTSLTADEAERLARAGAIKGKVEELRDARPKDEKERDDDVTKAIAEAGAANVAAGVLKVAPEAVDSQGDANLAKKELDELKAYYAELRRRAGDKDLDVGARDRAASGLAGSEEKLIAANLKLLAARQKTAEELAATGALGRFFPGGKDKLQAMVEANPDAFGPGGARLGSALGDAGKGDEAKAMEAEAKQGEKDWDAEEKRREEALKDQDKIDADEARRNAKKWDDDLAAAKKSRSFVDKADADLSPAEKEALGLHREFESGVDKARRGKTYDDKEDNELSPEEREASRRDHKHYKSVKDSEPGIEGLIRASLIAAMKAGSSPEAAQRALSGKLAGQFGADIAERLVGSQQGEAREQLMKDFVDGPERRKSSVIGAEGFADSIQSAVGGKEPNAKLEAKADRQIALLEQIANRPAGGGAVAFGADGNLAR